MCMDCVAAISRMVYSAAPARSAAVKRGARPLTKTSRRLSVPLIDAHSHVFNGADLPAESFLRIVFCKCYPPQQETARASLKCLGCAIAALALAFIRQFAPSATTERGELSGSKRSKAEPVPATGLTIVQFEMVIEAFLDVPRRSRQAVRLRKLFEGIIERQGVTQQAVDRLRRSIRQEAGLSLHRGPLTEPQMRSGAKLLSQSPLSVGTALRWIGLFLRRRGELVDRLHKIYTDTKFKIALLVPAMVDYSKWLNEEISSRSTFARQIEVMGRLSRRPSAPPMHGYVSFDPMRAIFHRKGLDRIDPYKLVRDAINKHGFLGVKLYPPMGFIPLQNLPHRPSASFAYFIAQALPRVNIRAELDDALSKLYGYCTASDNDVPIMAHAARSQGSNADYEAFADPRYWAHALQGFPTLRLNLAHFGGFYEAGREDYTPTWEWHFGELLNAYPNAKLYADVSFLEEILTGDSSERIKWGFKKFIEEYDNNVEHLMFGSDWIMLGYLEGNEDYAVRLADFLSAQVGMSDRDLRNLFRDNARRFLGLEHGTPALDRLRDFYGSNLAAKFDKLCRDLGI